MWCVTDWMIESRLDPETLVALVLLMHKLPLMYRALFVVFSAGILTGCVHVKLDPIEVNANVNVNVKLEKALNDFFGDLDKQSTTVVPLTP